MELVHVGHHNGGAQGLGHRPVCEEGKVSSSGGHKETEESVGVNDQIVKRKCQLQRWMVWLVKEYWFVLGIILVIILARLVPDIAKSRGDLAGEYSIGIGAVAIIFFTSGLSMRTEVMVLCLRNLRIHVFLQLLSLLIFPCLGYAIARGLQAAGFPKPFVIGLIVTMCMPTTTSTNVVFTAMAHGDEAIALVNACIGNIIGVFVSPATLRIFLSSKGMTEYSETVLQLVYTVVVPLVVGQVIHNGFPTQVAKLKQHVRLNNIGSVMIILLVWHVFSDTFAKSDIHDIPVAHFFLVALVDAAVYLLLTGISFGLQYVPYLSDFLGLECPATTVAVMMVAATKTVALGVPLVAIIYAKNPHKGLIILPLVLYHALQVIIGNLMISRLRTWRDKATLSSESTECSAEEQIIGNMGADVKDVGAAETL